MPNDDELPPDFDASYYLLINPDVAEAGQDAAEHYLRCGRQEGRSYSRTRPPQPGEPGSAGVEAETRAELGTEIERDARAALASTPARLGSGEEFKTVAVLGSAPSAPGIDALLGEQTILVTLNNAWRAATRRDYVLYADDFPDESKPPLLERSLRGLSSPQYLPAINAFGGQLYCGASLAFGAGYWILRALPFSQVSYFGADMVYTTQHSHFYGQGQPDPIRPDPSLQDHGAKCLRLFYFGLKNGCLFLNASASSETRLAFPRCRSGASLRTNLMKQLIPVLDAELASSQPLAAEALALERAATFDWQHPDYRSLIADERAWSHGAAVDARWRALEPMAARVEQAVQQALHAT